MRSRAAKRHHPSRQLPTIQSHLDCRWRLTLIDAPHLTKDQGALLAFYDFPAEHWQHIRTTNPIESVFATVRHRTVRSKGCLSHKTALAMVFKLVMAARESWRRLNGYDKLSQVIEGVKFTDGIQTTVH